MINHVQSVTVHYLKKKGHMFPYTENHYYLYLESGNCEVPESVFDSVQTGDNVTVIETLENGIHKSYSWKFE